MPSDHRYYDKGTFLISVHRYHNGEMRGVFYHPARREGGGFQSVIQLLLQMEQSMDQENLPQAFQSPRFFVPLRSLWSEGDTGRFLSGREATFAVSVHFRRNSTWQGQLLCKGDPCARPFRSVLELIGLMDDAMKARQQTGKPLPLREDA